MSSTIFYRFRSQKELSRILFDGTGITVFELKREIIQANRLTSSTDFNLLLYHSDDQSIEYTDDTEVIARSSTVVARRAPADKHGKGNASRYIAGKPRVQKSMGPIGGGAPQVSGTGLPFGLGVAGSAASTAAANGANGGADEEDMIKAMFSQQDDQWNEQQAVMATATRIDNAKQFVKPGEIEVPPAGYICYRCGARDHFIKNCPTNNDPNWETKRIKRTTGIPKSHLKTIKNPDEVKSANGDSGIDTYMVNESGEYVVAVADNKAWEKYQQISKQTEIEPDYDVKDVNMLDPITKKLLKDPVRTPCCNKMYSRSSIEDALLDSDFKCPNCGTEDILLDSLQSDEEMNEKLNKFKKEEDDKRMESKRKIEGEINNNNNQNGNNNQNIQSESDGSKKLKPNPVLPFRPDIQPQSLPIQSQMIPQMPQMIPQMPQMPQMSQMPQMPQISQMPPVPFVPFMPVPSQPNFQSLSNVKTKPDSPNK
ncbi:hypothetical protein B5S32_g3994 [[Candida] boidinii]|nr:hypothetical protein B5S32_g3994 [[Candida] boidinii]